jgi:hypothetical protein
MSLLVDVAEGTLLEEEGDDVDLSGEGQEPADQPGNIERLIDDGEADAPAEAPIGETGFRGCSAGKYCFSAKRRDPSIGALCTGGKMQIKWQNLLSLVQDL